MKPGPRAGAAARTDYVAKAKLAWAGSPPDWILALAEQATLSSAKATAARLGYSTSVISTAIANVYPGDLGRLEQKVRGAFMGATLDCPVLGEIGRDRCLDEQKEPFRSSSATRAQLFHHCNTPGRCPHSKKTAELTASVEGGASS
ncbi:transcriptional regulator [Hansschlegelia zhihuaiae]|uniref:Transcriptional regulator n=1 Tax=Hansschlegelia zhihuaiae TaxID=405005 RepID=A0A4Q0MMJ1_9HYPH|nr:transcriptional regulator [Hansschlegelia zhihuaiae]RXF75047.1 transcriptional regulator [Hansschlegelia zhihuaiae]